MSRPLGMEYPDAWYHVMNRGRRGRWRSDHIKWLISIDKYWYCRLKQAYIEYFGAKRAVFLRTLWREQRDILFRVTSGTPRLNRLCI